MTQSFYRWVACTDPRRPRGLERPVGTKLRIAQMTDLHVPGDISLSRRLRDLMSAPSSKTGRLSHDLSAISNEFSQPYRKTRKIYTNLLKKALVGLHSLDVDHLIITGDVAHCGLDAEFLEVKAVLQLTGWWGGEKLTVIPGNHDRFNLYEHIPGEPMESFFDVVCSRHPRIKTLPGGVALVEVDSNSDRVDDRAYTERWLPNTMGCIYDEDVDVIAAAHAQMEGMRVLTLVHHHISQDWYRLGTYHKLGFLNPVKGMEPLMDAVRMVDPKSLILHGHIHDVMPLGYTWNGHLVGCPGGFAEHARLHVIDVDVHDDIVMTQLELRR